MDNLPEWTSKLNNIALEGISILRNLNSTENNVVIFDIDSTLIDSCGKRINPIITVFDYAKLLNISIAIITSRIGTYNNIEKTQDQLENNHITGYKYIYFLKPHDYDVAKFKSNARQSLIEKGYNIVMTFGDMDWDLDFENGTPFKIPVLEIKNSI